MEVPAHAAESRGKSTMTVGAQVRVIIAARFGKIDCGGTDCSQDRHDRCL
jgi:hypothetical protein